MDFRKILVAGLCLLGAGAAMPVAAGSFDCSVVYDEFDSLMNKNFLLKPDAYVPVVKGRISRDDYNTKQKGRLLLRPARQGWGAAVVRTNKNSWGKFVFTWGGRGDARGTPLLIIRDLTLYGRVEDGRNARQQQELRIAAAQQIDLDSGRADEGDLADIYFRNVDGKTMYLEAVNGAELIFPMGSMCSRQ